MKDNLLFDLDGTIIDPAVGITGAAKYALETMGYPTPSQKELEKFIGPPLDESFTELYQFTPEQSEQGILHFRDYFAKHGIHEHHLYPGFSELLPALKQKGFTLYIATSKPTVFARQILDGYGLTSCFAGLQGSDLESPGCPKGEIIRKVLEKHAIAPSTALMIGDRKHDIVGAKQQGVASVGLLHGYGGQQELQEAKADYILPDVAALAKFLGLSV